MLQKRKIKIKDKILKLRKKISSRAVILMYHRVDELAFDPFGLCVSPKHFEEHLEVIRAHAHPISLQELSRALQQGSIPHGSVAITFDDGYADNLHHGKPLLERYQIPATFFVSTGQLGKQEEMWWDELERLLLTPGELPPTLELSLNGSIRTWHLGEAVHYSEQDLRRDQTNKAWLAASGSRLYIYNDIWKILRTLIESERGHAMAQIQAWAQNVSNPRASHRFLSPQELVELATGNCIEIGAHTVSHPLLTAHSIDKQRQEIKDSKEYLEDLLKLPISSFSYPFGKSGEATTEVVRSIAFDCACSTVEDVVWRQSDRFQLPRFAVENWPREEFKAKLMRWLHR